MYRILINEVGMLYSWEGAKKKKAFKNLSIADIILGKDHKQNRNCK
jgi:hypothetical protein